ncbi:MAG: putative prophage phiRv2 integrase [Firmicutes bacterium]|nr:putative prophage phiRv2 integrase [Bacillota bacterium]
MKGVLQLQERRPSSCAPYPSRLPPRCAPTCAPTCTPAITLPWKKPEGPKVTKRLYFTNTAGGIVWRSNFNVQEWKPALAVAGLIPDAGPDGNYESAREHGMHALRHFYASVLLDAGESIQAVSQYLGHTDPALTLRVYAHIMPSSQERTRKAVDHVFLKVADRNR